MLPYKIDNYDYHMQERIFRKVICTNYYFMQVLIMCYIRWVCLFLLVCWFYMGIELWRLFFQDSIIIKSLKCCSEHFLFCWLSFFNLQFFLSDKAENELNRLKLRFSQIYYDNLVRVSCSFDLFWWLLSKVQRGKTWHFLHATLSIAWKTNGWPQRLVGSSLYSSHPLCCGFKSW